MIRNMMLSDTNSGALDDTARRERPAGCGLTKGVEARKRAFTLIELLVVIAIIAILAAILLPVMQAAKLRAYTATCIANQSQLAKAWVMYSSDNNDYTVGDNWQDEEAWNLHTNENWVSGWEDPCTTAPNTAAGSGDSDSTNINLLCSPMYSTLAQYIGWQPGIFLCPASVVRVHAYPTSKLVRTVSMNAWVGYNTPASGNTNTYKVFYKSTTMTAGIGPADVFVFIEERGESIDDGFFAVTSPGGSTDDILQNMPSNNHNMACTLGFGDGHVEVHKWLGLPGFTPTGGNPPNCNITTPQQEDSTQKWASLATTGMGTVSRTQLGDLGWMELHATCLK